jgi:hypothetical protein
MALMADEHIVGGLALFETSTRWGPTLGPRLLLQYNGFVLADNESRYPSHRTAADIHSTDRIAEFVEEQGYASTVVKCRWPFADTRAFLKRGWRAVPTYTYIMPLSDLEQQWDFVDRNLRRLIRRCEREGLSVSVDDDFDSFYRLHQQTHERKGSPIYLPENKFRAYFEQLHEAGIARLYQARLPNGTPIAAQLVLAGQQPTCETVSACADGQYLDTGANAFLRWKVFEKLAEDGYAYNDLTDAGLNSVTRFKSRFGGDLRVCFALIYPSTRRYRFGTRLERVARSVLRR